MKHETINIPTNNLTDRQLALTIATMYAGDVSIKHLIDIADKLYDWLTQKQETQ